MTGLLMRFRTCLPRTNFCTGKADDTAKEKDRFDMRGHKLDTPQYGVNIVRMNDGTARKVVVK